MLRLLLSLVLLFCGVCNGSKLVFVDVQPCPVPKHDLQNGFKFDLKYDNVTRSADGHMITPFAIDDDIEFEASAEQMTNGKWEVSDFNLQGSLCVSVDMYMPSVAAKIAKAFNQKELCPLQKGEYKLEKFTIDDGEVAFPEMPQGMHYKIKVVYKKNDTPITCFTYEMAVV